MVTDHAGRQVDVPENPIRVVSLAPSITEIVFAVDRGDRLVGVTEYSNYPQNAREIPSVGSYVYLDLEKIFSLEPDLCIAIKDGNPIGVIRRLQELDIPVFAVNPRDLESVMTSLSDIGALLGTKKKADEVVADMKTRIKRVRQKVDEISRRPGVFFQIGISPIVSAGTDTFIHELIVEAGGRNLAADNTGYPRYTTEEVLALAPEIIVVTSMARAQMFDKVLKKYQKWEDLPAVAHNRIYLVNSDLVDRPSPRLVKGLEKLTRLIHPELFEADSESN
ncbi:MAG: cobalamin-binding protein [Desulfobacterales bacterium]|nr:cobalamin-binding protein [Desulfobacterales bacterium]MBS3754641.1 cobalamin-binding protein [Desulfobacterales bacterium]